MREQCSAGGHTPGQRMKRHVTEPVPSSPCMREHCRAEGHTPGQRMKRHVTEPVPSSLCMREHCSAGGRTRELSHEETCRCPTSRTSPTASVYLPRRCPSPCSPPGSAACAAVMLPPGGVWWPHHLHSPSSEASWPSAALSATGSVIPRLRLQTLPKFRPS